MFPEEKDKFFKENPADAWVSKFVKNKNVQFQRSANDRA